MSVIWDSYMACHAFWMWWQHEALATSASKAVMVLNTAVWGRAIERAVRGIRRQFVLYDGSGAAAGEQTSALIWLRALRPGARYTITAGTNGTAAAYERTTAQLEQHGLRVPLSSGEGTLTVELVLGPGDGEVQQLAAAESAQGELSNAYAALQAAPLVGGRVAAGVAKLVPVYSASLVDYRASRFADAAFGARRVTAALRRPHQGVGSAAWQQTMK
eukprot:SAG11_NODE_42_length_20827_cov_9.289801_4_plen_217_part_00